MNPGDLEPTAPPNGSIPERHSPSNSQSPPASAPRIPDHALLKVIGRGSYGEVWLARNVLGEFRAVKLIYRRAFEQDRPFERELEGIRQFEPVSRTHPSQLNVLHVGRNDAAGHFYYVMELADDSNAECGTRNAELATGAPVSTPHSALRTPHSYAPRTLKHDLDRRGRLPVEECLRLGLALTTALEHLHAHGLVHRDVKPSNIIFVHGVPKLADIGLVTSMEATMSFVGTSGFLPPEGPGTPKADLYSLGKVLYEASTGRDRQEFPKLPANLDEWDDAPRLVELNAVILKACANDPRQRYQSAHEMAADLLLLQRGQSVKTPPHRRTPPGGADARRTGR
jgi:serine/threonine protein kinase